MDARHLAIFREMEEIAGALAGDAGAYWAEHRKRYGLLARLLDDLYGDGKRATPRRVLDVGPSFQTLILARLFPGAHLATMGIEDSRYRPSEDTRHVPYDLNDAYFRDSWPEDEGYDLILMLEVIEHLYTSPWRVLGLLRHLSSAGGLVIVSTPNALFLKTRLTLLRGANPFEMLEDERHRLGLGHHREYTQKELTAMGERVGLCTAEVRIDNALLRSDDREQRLYDRITTWLPASFRQMLTMVFANESDGAEVVDQHHVPLAREEGWFPPERDPAEPTLRWQWTGQRATLSFAHPHRKATFYLRLAGQEDGGATAQQVSVVIGDRQLRRLVVQRHDATHTLAIHESALGDGEQVELELRVDRTFVPSSQGASDDHRELGVRVLSCAMMTQ